MRRSRFGGLAVGLLVSVLALAASPATEPTPRFGVMTHFAQGWDPALASLIAEGGIRQVRDELYWNDVEPEKGVFKFPPQHDAYLDALTRAGITPLIVLSFENKHYDDGNTPHTEEAFAAYARYAVEVLRHCGPRVKAVEIWNEYNGSFNKGPASQDRAATYVKMLRVAYAAIKAERPDVIVVGGATAGVPMPYLEKLFSAGALDCLDALSIHPYRYESAPEGIEDVVAGVRQLMGSYGAAKPIWVTEIGWQLKPSKASGDLAIDEATQAKFLARSFALLESAGVARTYWYLFRDTSEFSMGLVRDGEPPTLKPAYHAMDIFLHQLATAHFEEREQTADGFYSLRYRDERGRERRIIWSLTPQTVKLTGARQVVDLFGKPVDLATDLVVGDAPFFVSGRWRGQPPPDAKRGPVVADSVRDFSRHNDGAWRYGYFEGGNAQFQPLPNYAVTDWKAEWAGAPPYLSITSLDQHPSAVNNQPVVAARRWISDHEGNLRVSGQFRCGTQGDGVGVAIAIDGQKKFRQVLGAGSSVREDFDFVVAVRKGTVVDFLVDPGPATDINSDVTTLVATLRAER